MSRQIIIIWILSLISVLLLIGIQGYWLINQYEYVLNIYSEEIASQVLKAGEEEFLLRKKESPLSAAIMMSPNNDTAHFKYRVIIGAIAPGTSIVNDEVPPLREQTSLFQSIRQVRFDGNHSQPAPIVVNIDTTQFNMSFETNLTGDELRSAGERVISNLASPFNRAQLDSILVSMLPTLKYSIFPWQEEDTYDNYVVWKRTGALFNPHLTISYAYSPLENLGVFIHVKLPIQPVFYRMGILLVVSIGLTLLLIICLVFQLKNHHKAKESE
jgi:hypothetical protein